MQAGAVGWAGPRLPGFDGAEVLSPRASSEETSPLMGIALSSSVSALRGSLAVLTERAWQAAATVSGTLPQYAEALVRKSRQALRVVVSLNPLLTTIAPVSAWIAASAWLQHALTGLPQPRLPHTAFPGCVDQLRQIGVPLPYPKGFAELSPPVQDPFSALSVTSNGSVYSELTVPECYDLIAYESLETVVARIIEQVNMHVLHNNARLRRETSMLAIGCALAVTVIAVTPVLTMRVRQWINRNAETASAEGNPEQRLERLRHFLDKMFISSAGAAGIAFVSMTAATIDYVKTVLAGWESATVSDFFSAPFCQLRDEGLSEPVINALNFPSYASDECAAQAQQHLSLVDFQKDYVAHDLARQWLQVSLCAFLVAAFTALISMTAPSSIQTARR